MSLIFSTKEIEELLNNECEYLLGHKCSTILKEHLTIPNPDIVSSVFQPSDRNNRVLKNLQSIFSTGRLGNTGYTSILPVDQGVEHSAGASFCKNMEYMDPKNIVELAIEAGCNAVASTYGVLSLLSRQYAHKIPFILKLNHNELLSYPTNHHQIPFASVEQAYDMGAAAVGATIYFGSQTSEDEIIYVSKLFARAHELGMGTILWCYLRNPAFSTSTDYHLSADLSGQANHLGATIGADILKQKMPENNGGYTALKFGKTDPLVYSDLTTDHPIDLCRYQVANGYMGKIGLINSGGASNSDKEKDFLEIARTAVINKRAGGMGLIAGRKAFQRPREEGVKMLNLIQDIYLNDQITIA